MFRSVDGSRSEASAPDVPAVDRRYPGRHRFDDVGVPDDWPAGGEIKGGV
jgi:hypothetical protein